MASNQNVNKVIYAGTTLIDLTGDDVTAGDVLSGKKFHLPSGAEATGTLQVVNRNLLDNWYFVGGGSQLGDGVFPINQRGQTNYTGIGYTIDRWLFKVSEWTINLIADGINFINNGSGWGQFVQTLTSGQSAGLAGKTVNLSFLTADGLAEVSATIPSVLPTSDTLIKNKALSGMSVHLRCVNGSIYVRVTGNASSTSPLQAIKLELGSEQTLAHNEGTEENPVWVLNEVPDYGEELRKCQRYYQLFRTESLRPTYGEDCRPTMATEQPTKGTLTKGGVTYYTLSSES